MTNPSVEELISLVAKTEKTPELSQYWQSRYKKILENQLFELSDKTNNLVFSEDLVEKPGTPFGDIVLTNHLDANKHLDEVKLQSTIETAVRFLDACLEAINFDKSSRFIVEQFRKIGLGIGDVEEFLEIKQKEQELQEIDKLGLMISNIAYRASENLAEEKGPCSKWTKINKHLRPKSFEIWENLITGERKTGLELVEELDQETIEKTQYTIIPRRNSNILLLPPDLEWQIWSDRDDSSPITEIEELSLEAPKIELPELTFNSDKITSDREKSNQEVESELGESKLEIEVLPDKEFLEEKIEAEQEILKHLPNYPEDSDSIKQSIPYNQNLNQSLQNITSNSEEPNPEVSISQPLINVEDVTFEEKFFDNFDKHSEQNSGESETPDPLLDENLSEPFLDEEFQIGELVQVLKENDEFNGVISQIVDIISGNETAPQRYKLEGGIKGIGKALWSSQDLQPVDLEEILYELNSKIGNYSDEDQTSKLDEIVNKRLQEKEIELQARLQEKFDTELEEKLRIQEENNPIMLNLEEQLAKKEQDLKQKLETEIREKVRYEIAEEMRAEYEQKANETLNDDQDRQLLLQEIELLKQQLQNNQTTKSNTENNLHEEIQRALEEFVASEEFEKEVENRVNHYLESDEVEKEIESRVQERVAQRKPTTNSSKPISTLQMMKKYQK